MGKKIKWIAAALALIAGGFAIVWFVWLDQPGGSDQNGDLPGLPKLALSYMDQDYDQQSLAPDATGYRWQLERDGETGDPLWDTVGPGVFFVQSEGIEIFEAWTGGVQLQLDAADMPDKTVVKFWPSWEWTPGDTAKTHGAGQEIPVEWHEGDGTVGCSIQAVPGSLLSVTLTYGEAWVEYAFIVKGHRALDDPLSGSAEELPALESFTRLQTSDEGDEVNTYYEMTAEEQAAFVALMRGVEWSPPPADALDRGLDSVFRVWNDEGDYLAVDKYLEEGRTVFILRYNYLTQGAGYNTSGSLLEDLLAFKASLPIPSE
jgi:hypothetical protein